MIILKVGLIFRNIRRTIKFCFIGLFTLWGQLLEDCLPILNRWLRGIKTSRFPWCLTQLALAMLRATQAWSNFGFILYPNFGSNSSLPTAKSIIPSKVVPKLVHLPDKLTSDLALEKRNVNRHESLRYVWYVRIQS